ncbi:MAG: hypothetical protein LBP79_05090 [Clostridiales bacterium]|nr:hypothetical protein [Clostridiales bacterium]
MKNYYTDGDCTVSIEFEKDGKIYEITRNKGKSLALTVDGKDCSGKETEQTRAVVRIRQ